MSDLISRKALMEALMAKEVEYEYVMCIPSWTTALHVIRNQPTAYDVKSVVEQLEELKYKPCPDTKNCTDFITCEQHFMQKAIEIVKGGAV